METTPPPWRPPRLWRGAQALARGIVALLSRLEITGDVPARCGAAADPGRQPHQHLRPDRARRRLPGPRASPPGSWPPAGCSGPRSRPADAPLRPHPGGPARRERRRRTDPRHRGAHRRRRWCWSTRRGASAWTRGCGPNAARPAPPASPSPPASRWCRWPSGERTRCCPTGRPEGTGPGRGAGAVAPAGGAGALRRRRWTSTGWPRASPARRCGPPTGSPPRCTGTLRPLRADEPDLPVSRGPDPADRDPARLASAAAMTARRAYCAT